MCHEARNKQLNKTLTLHDQGAHKTGQQNGSDIRETCVMRFMVELARYKLYFFELKKKYFLFWKTWTKLPKLLKIFARLLGVNSYELLSWMFIIKELSQDTSETIAQYFFDDEKHRHVLL